MSLAFNRGPRLEHLVRGQSGVAGEVAKLRKDVGDAFDVMEAGAPVVASFDAPSAAIVDADGIKAAFASAATPVTLTGTDFDGVLAPDTGPALLNSPRRVTLIVAGSGTPADWLGGTVTVIGTDSDGAPLEEDVTSAAGAGTTTTVGYFATVEQVELPAAADVNASLTLGVAADTGAIMSFASSTDAQIFDGADNDLWNRDRIGNREMSCARRITFIFDAQANWDATTGTIRGRDARGEQISETFAIPNGGGTVSTTKFYKSIERIDIPAQSGSAGTCQVGPLENQLGLPTDPVSDVEAAAVIREISRANDAAAWAVPGTAGAVDDSSVTASGPYGKYTPHSSVVVDGVRDYKVVYVPKAA